MRPKRSGERAERASSQERRASATRDLEHQTDEGAQELAPLSPEAKARELVFTGGPWPDVDDTMILNMGP